MRDTYTIEIETFSPGSNGDIQTGEISLDVKFEYYRGTDSPDDPSEINIISARETDTGRYFDWTQYEEQILEKIERRLNRR